MFIQSNPIEKMFQSDILKKVDGRAPDQVII